MTDYPPTEPTDPTPEPATPPTDPEPELTPAQPDVPATP